MSCSSMSSCPLMVTELLQLTNLGIPLKDVCWPKVTLVSDKLLSVCHKGNPKKLSSPHYSAVTVLNPHLSFPQTWETSASSAKMSPVAPVIALRAGYLFQVYDLEKHKCITKYKLISPVCFWTWLNETVIAIVTDVAVFHWNTESKSGRPEVIFFRHSRLENAQIVNYVADPTFQWAALTGLFLEENRVTGVTQVYSVEQNISQVFDAHWVNLVSAKLTGNQSPSTLMIVANRTSMDRTGKLHVVELGPQLPGNMSLSFHSESLDFTDIWDRYNFPVNIQVSCSLGLIYVVTKFGTVYLCDLETAMPLCCCTVCPDIMFTATLNQDTQGILAVSRNGQVLAIDLKKEHLIKHTKDVVKKPHIADRLSIVLAKLKVQ